MALVVSLVVAGCTAGTSRGVVGVIPDATVGKDEGRVQGFVTDDQQLPVAEAQVAVLDVRPPLVAKTDRSGSYVIPNVPPGRHQVAVSALGFDSVARSVDVVAGVPTVVEIQLKAIAVAGVPYRLFYVGQGYIACGAYLIVVTVSNLNLCVFDSNHKPRYEFTTPRDHLFGIAQEVVWQKNSALTSDKLFVYLWYKPVCSPTCTATKSFAQTNAKSPVRQYGDLSGESFQEDPVPLASMTFVGGSGAEVVIVFQQRITHYITAFYNAPGNLNATAIPA